MAPHQIKQQASNDWQFPVARLLFLLCAVSSKIIGLLRYICLSFSTTHQLLQLRDASEDCNSNMFHDVPNCLWCWGQYCSGGTKAVSAIASWKKDTRFESQRQIPVPRSLHVSNFFCAVYGMTRVQATNRSASFLAFSDICATNMFHWWYVLIKTQRSTYISVELDFLKHGKKADIISQRVKALFAMQTWHAYKVRRPDEQGDPHDWPAKAKWKWLECFHLQALHRVLVNSIVWSLLWAIQSCLSNSRWIRIVLAVEGLNFRHHVLLEVYKTIEKAVAVLSSLCVCVRMCVSLHFA